ncbi:MAG TPA: alpha/beta hydrolase [Acidimicrobiales bacterium]
MTTYVLVHGAFGGAHTWRHVRARMQAAGQDVFTPALTGIGERWHLSSPQVTLETHVEDVANVLIYWDLRDVVLLGYSYGGRVVSSSLRHIADRVAHLVYLDTSLPSAGLNMSPWGINSLSEGLGTPWLREAVPLQGDFYDDPAQAAFHGPRRSPQPVKTLADSFVLGRPLEEYPFTRTYIKASRGEKTGVAGASWDAADRAKSSSDWRYHELDTNHAIPENRPAELVEILMGLV